MLSQKVLRHEKKFTISPHEHRILRSLLKGIFSPDPNGDENGIYFVRSVYFDSLDNDNYYDKIIGLDHRKKLRARLYDVNAHTMKLEIKEKKGDMLLKHSLTLDREAYQDLIHHRYEFLEAYPQVDHEVFKQYLNESYQKAVITIDYDREAYVHAFSNLRINFDMNIRVHQSQYDLFDPLMIMTPISIEPYCVLEIKYNDFMPDWLMSMINSVVVTHTSYSKYCLGRTI